MIRWPRGRYNGQRIVGVDLKVAIDLLHWRFWGPSRFTWTVAIGPLRAWWSWRYEDRY